MTKSKREGRRISGMNSFKKQETEGVLYCGKKLLETPRKCYGILQFEFLGTVMTLSVSSGIWAIVILG